METLDDSEIRNILIERIDTRRQGVGIVAGIIGSVRCRLFA
jgi:hypothetical protein